MNSTEQFIWRGTPSQHLNIPIFAVCGLVFLIFSSLNIVIGLIPLAYAGWKYYELSSNVYELTTERLIVQKGTFSRITDQLELHRIRDYRLHEPIHLRFFGLSNIELITDDRTDPILMLNAISNGKTLLREIRKNAEIRKQQNPNRDIDIRFLR